MLKGNFPRLYSEIKVSRNPSLAQPSLPSEILLGASDSFPSRFFLSLIPRRVSSDVESQKAVGNSGERSEEIRKPFPVRNLGDIESVSKCLKVLNENEIFSSLSLLFRELYSLFSRGLYCFIFYSFFSFVPSNAWRWQSLHCITISFILFVCISGLGNESG